jgi:hypothetical protein
MIATAAREILPREEMTLLSSFMDPHEMESLGARPMLIMLFLEKLEDWKREMSWVDGTSPFRKARGHSFLITTQHGAKTQFQIDAIET